LDRDFSGDMSALAAIFYVLALWFTFRLTRAIIRSAVEQPISR
jgi:hypothetical protein